MTTRLLSASGYWIRAPITRPYELSFGTLHAFEMVVVRVTDSDGRTGYGESCPVPPYSSESPSQVWEATCATLPGLPGMAPEQAFARVAERAEGSASYAHVACATAVEALVDPPRPAEKLAVPVVGTMLTHNRDALARELRRLLDTGYSTLKLKVGFDPAEDAAMVSAIQGQLPARVQLRLDANEGYDLDQALAFLDRLDPAAVELFEQPCPRDRWDWVTRLKREQHPVPLMLDESIHGEDDIERAAEAGIDIVKLKLMKTGTRRALSRRTGLAQHLGLSVVIGNGVAGVIDNLYEALHAAQTGRAGEMNGALKLADPIFGRPPWLESGKLTFPEGFVLQAPEDELARRSQKSMTVSA